MIAFVAAGDPQERVLWSRGIAPGGGEGGGEAP